MVRSEGLSEVITGVQSRGVQVHARPGNVIIGGTFALLYCYRCCHHIVHIQIEINEA